MVNIDSNIWHWYHNISECYYHIQLTIKYRKSLFNDKIEQVIIDSIKGIKERYAINILQQSAAGVASQPLKTISKNKAEPRMLDSSGYSTFNALRSLPQGNLHFRGRL